MYGVLNVFVMVSILCDAGLFLWLLSESNRISRLSELLENTNSNLEEIIRHLGKDR